MIAPHSTTLYFRTRTSICHHFIRKKAKAKKELVLLSLNEHPAKIVSIASSRLGMFQRIDKQNRYNQISIRRIDIECIQSNFQRYKINARGGKRRKRELKLLKSYRRLIFSVRMPDSCNYEVPNLAPASNDFQKFNRNTRAQSLQGEMCECVFFLEKTRCRGLAYPLG